MDRRKSIKALLVGTVSAGVLVEACNTEEKKAPEQGAAATTDNTPPAGSINRMKEEAEWEKQVRSATFFTPDEMATITILGNIIIPKDDISGSASDAGVPAFIEFIVKDMPEHQIPMRGGLRWLDMQCLHRYSNTFRESSPQQQLEMVTDIAYPAKTKPDMLPGVSFFNRLRDLTATGFFTTPIGFKDLGYVGNTPNMWTGVPADVLKEHGFGSVWG